ncbi:MAG: hypothetical protein GY714_00065 [Desulfobacterales bacterium]|nr:hypothetical protein [Desulfobacterales bacterium]
MTDYLIINKSSKVLVVDRIIYKKEGIRTNDFSHNLMGNFLRDSWMQIIIPPFSVYPDLNSKDNGITVDYWGMMRKNLRDQ